MAAQKQLYTLDVEEGQKRNVIEYQFALVLGELSGRRRIISTEQARRSRTLDAASVILRTSVRLSAVVRDEYTRRRRATFYDEPRAFLLLRATGEKSRYQAIFLEKKRILVDKLMVKYAESVIWDGVLGPREAKERAIIEEEDEPESRAIIRNSFTFLSRFVDAWHTEGREGAQRQQITESEDALWRDFECEFSAALDEILLRAAANEVDALLAAEALHRRHILGEEEAVKVVSCLSEAWIIELYKDHVEREVLAPHSYHMFNVPPQHSQHPALDSDAPLSSLRTLPTACFALNLQFQIPVLAHREARERVFLQAMEENAWNNELVGRRHVPTWNAWRRLQACRNIQATGRAFRARALMGFILSTKSREFRRANRAKLRATTELVQRFLSMRNSQLTLCLRRLTQVAHVLHRFVRAYSSVCEVSRLQLAMWRASDLISRVAASYSVRKAFGLRHIAEKKLTVAKAASAARIQRWVRPLMANHKSRAATKVVVRRRHIAAARIQSLWKGVSLRGGFASEGGIRDQLLSRKAVKLQRVFRGCIVRHMVFYPIIRATLILRFARAKSSHQLVQLRQALFPYRQTLRSASAGYLARCRVKRLRDARQVEMQLRLRQRSAEVVTGIMRRSQRKSAASRRFNARMEEVGRRMYIGPLVPIDTLCQAANGYRARRRCHKLAVIKLAAATAVQCHARWLQSSIHVQNTALRRNLNHHLQILLAFAHAWRTATTVLPDQARYMIARHADIQAAAVAVRPVIQGFLTRRYIGIQRHQRQRASRSIQCAHRQHISRRILKEKRDANTRRQQALRETRAATTIQRWFKRDLYRRWSLAAATIQLFFHRVHPAIVRRQENRAAKEGIWRFERQQLEREASFGERRKGIHDDERNDWSAIIALASAELPRSGQGNISLLLGSAQLLKDDVLAIVSKLERREEHKRLLIERSYLAEMTPTTNRSTLQSVPSTIADLYEAVFLPQRRSILASSHSSQIERLHGSEGTLRGRLVKEERNTRRNLLVFHYQRCTYLFTNIECVDVMRNLDKGRDEIERAEVNERSELESILDDALRKAYENALADESEASVYTRTLLQTSNPYSRLVSKDRQWSYNTALAGAHRRSEWSDSTPEPRRDGSGVVAPIKSNPFLALNLPVVMPPKFTDSRDGVADICGSASFHTTAAFSRSEPLITDVAPTTTQRMGDLYEHRLTMAGRNQATTPTLDACPTLAGSFKAWALDTSSIVLTVVFPNPLLVSLVEEESLRVTVQSTIDLDDPMERIPFDTYRTRSELVVDMALASIETYAADNQATLLGCDKPVLSIQFHVSSGEEAHQPVTIPEVMQAVAGGPLPTKVTHLLNSVVRRRIEFLEEAVANLLRQLDVRRLEHHKAVIHGWRPRSDTPPLLLLTHCLHQVDLRPMVSGVWNAMKVASLAAPPIDSLLVSRSIRGLLSHALFQFAKGMVDVDAFHKQTDLANAAKRVDSVAPSLSSAARHSSLPPLETAREWLQQSRRRKQLLDAVSTSGVTEQAKKDAKVNERHNKPPVSPPDFDAASCLFLPSVTRIDTIPKDLFEFMRDFDRGALEVIALANGLEAIMGGQRDFRGDVSAAGAATSRQMQEAPSVPAPSKLAPLKVAPSRISR